MTSTVLDNISRFYKLALNLSVEILDKSFCSEIIINNKRSLMEIKFIYNNDPEIVLVAFIKTAKYFNTFIIRLDDDFYIIHDNLIFILSFA